MTSAADPHRIDVGEEFDRRYRAVCSRDRRFDGTFFTGVTSTGVYCRPSCPAQTPKPANVRFYPVAAAAEAAGFRACRRCRPEAAPGSPDWDVRADLTGRALRLVAAGAVDADGVGGLARRLSVSERQLHRVLVAEVGAGPLALARTRRAQTARLLVESTDLPLSEVAFAAGFASIRQFNDTMRASFGRTPRELRRGDRAPAPAADGALVVRLQHRMPFDADPLMRFHRDHAVAGCEESTTDGWFVKAVRLPYAPGVVALRPAGPAQDGRSHVDARLQLTDLRDLPAAVDRCRRLLDLDADPHAVDAHLGADPLVGPLVADHPGLRVPGSADPFETAVRAVLGQQVSVKAARTFTMRLVEQLGQALPAPVGAVTRLFPTPAQIADGDLSTLGLTGARQRTLTGLAAAVHTGQTVLDGGVSRDEVQRQLVALRGIGPWTAGYVAMRALGDPDVLLGSDLAIRAELRELTGDDSPAALTALSRRARPWSSYATQHLWTHFMERTSKDRTRQ